MWVGEKGYKENKRYNTEIVLRAFDIQTSDEHTVNDHVRESQHSVLNNPQGALPTPVILTPTWALSHANREDRSGKQEMGRSRGEAYITTCMHGDWVHV